MLKYRILRLNEGDRPLGSAIAATHATDQDAITEARRTFEVATIEIWQGERRIAVLRANEDPPHV
jgi:hypothetical protein